MKNLVSFLELNEKSKDNAEWEIRQRNQVAKYMKLKSKEITIYNSLFYRNGVFAKFNGLDMDSLIGDKPKEDKEDE